MTSSPRSAARADSRRAQLVRAGGWAATCASVRGSAHERDGRPNQDAVAVGVLAPPRSGLVAAVADGHGGSAYVRSDVGARCAVEVAVALATESTAAPSPDLVVDAWRRAVSEHASANPFTPAEESLTGGDVMCAYGSTLLLAVADDQGSWLCKLGDGDVLAIGADAATWSPLPADSRLAGGVTTSLCLPTAAQDTATTTLPVGGVDVLVLATDGYGAAFADARWRERVGADLWEAVGAHGVSAVAASLPGWLADSAHMGGDDVSLALLVRESGGPSPLS